MEPIYKQVDEAMRKRIFLEAKEIKMLEALLKGQDPYKEEDEVLPDFHIVDPVNGKIATFLTAQNQWKVKKLKSKYKVNYSSQTILV